MRLVDDIRRCGKGLCAAEKGPGPVHSERRARALCENFRDARLGVPFAGRVRERGRARSCWCFGAEANRLFRLLAASSVARRFLGGTKSLPERGDSPAACSGRPSRRDSFSGGSPPQPSGRGRNCRHVGARSRAPIQNQNRSYVSVPVLPRLSGHALCQTATRACSSIARGMSSVATNGRLRCATHVLGPI